VLIEGNDPRLIDIGLLSKLPFGAVTSWQHIPDPLDGNPLFSRDLLQVDVLNTSRKERLFTIFNNHLKSHFVPFTAADPVAEQARANELRRRQCQAAAAIIAAETRPNSRYLVLGDMNDPPDSEFMAPLAESTQLKLTLGLSNPTETRPAPRLTTAAHRRLDGTLQAQRQTSRLHAHGPGLAQPCARRQTDRRLHRPTQQSQRRRQRPRPRLDHAQSLSRSSVRLSCSECSS
jgi:hypothetical protein